MPDHNLSRRIDAGYVGTDPAPPRRRYRLVLDAHADTREGLDNLLTNLSLSVYDEALLERTSGGPDSGYHVEVIDHGPEFTHERYVGDLTRWRMERHGIPAGQEVTDA